ncbi:MAG: hypothetical protein J6C27_00700 [Clostridia bacterium]|nr:hypothetical protein [Clostridia bacterium]
MKKNTLIKIALIFLVLAFLINQAVSMFYKPVTTDSAVFYTANNGFKITGVIVRNEILVTNDKSGVLHYLISDGERVSKNGTIANIYGSEAASITLSQIESVQHKIDDINSILSFNDLEAANLELINSRVNDNLNALIMSTAAGNFGDIPKTSEELLFALNRRQAALGNTSSFATQLSALNSQLETLNSSLTGVQGEVTAVQSGYFLSKTDGYEGVLNAENLEGITPEFLDGLKSEKTAGNVVGKIVSDYEWYIAAKVSINDSHNYKEGDTLKIYTSVKSSPVLPVTVKRINTSSASTEAVIVFACSEMNSELASLRSGPMTVVSREYSGLKVPKRALRVVDGQKGVYIVKGMQAKFVPVEILYSTDNMMICKKNDADGQLRLYDQVIVKGRNLYDGKIIG